MENLRLRRTGAVRQLHASVEYGSLRVVVKMEIFAVGLRDAVHDVVDRVAAALIHGGGKEHVHPRLLRYRDDDVRQRSAIDFRKGGILSALAANVPFWEGGGVENDQGGEGAMKKDICVVFEAHVNDSQDDLDIFDLRNIGV